MIPKHIIDLEDLSVADIRRIAENANVIRQKPQDYADVCHGKIMATLFYEPSTRTQMSFKTAMLRLGGTLIGFDNPNSSSVAKGESLKDTITVVSGYADIITIRHPSEGTAKAASLYSYVPVINAGDGGHLHPTQTLTDIVTLYNERGSLENMCIGLCGDLKNGRTVHSLIKTMSHFRNNRFILISTAELGVPQYIKDILNAAGCEYAEMSSLKEAMPYLDVLYMTRIQRERFSSEEDYQKQKGVYILDRDKLQYGKKDLKILHPLPRVDEIDYEIDEDERAKYFIQTVYGVYARMALIMELLKNPDHTQAPRLLSTHPAVCSNPRCITHSEPYLPHIFRESGDMLLCNYCDGRTLI